MAWRTRAAIVDIVEQASGCPTITTAQAITQAFDHVGIKKLVLISPYVKATNQHEVNYLSETGYTVLHELGLALETHGYRQCHAGGMEKRLSKKIPAPMPTAIFSAARTRA